MGCGGGACSPRTLRWPVIGLTGSAGKTSTKEFLAAYPAADACLEVQQFLGVAADTVQCQPRPRVCGSSKMGMNQSGEIARLSETDENQPVALVVNVQPVHLEKLGSLEAIRRENLSIAQGLPRTACGVADRCSSRRNGTAKSSASMRAEVRELKHAPPARPWVPQTQLHCLQPVRPPPGVSPNSICLPLTSRRRHPSSRLEGRASAP